MPININIIFNLATRFCRLIKYTRPRLSLQLARTIVSTVKGRNTASATKNGRNRKTCCFIAACTRYVTQPLLDLLRVLSSDPVVSPFGLEDRFSVVKRNLDGKLFSATIRYTFSHTYTFSSWFQVGEPLRDSQDVRFIYLFTGLNSLVYNNNKKRK